MTSRASHLTFYLCKMIGCLNTGWLTRPGVVLWESTALQLGKSVGNAVVYHHSASFWIDTHNTNTSQRWRPKTERDTYLMYAELTQSSRGQNRGGGGQ